MSIKRTILQPVKRADFSTVISPDGSSAFETDPLLKFSPVIDQFKKLATGQYFWFIADARNGTTYQAGGMVEQLTDIPIEQFVKAPPDALFGQTHPEDLPPMFAFTNHWLTYIQRTPVEHKAHLHATIYVRLKNIEGLYKWVMVQFVDEMVDEKGNVLYGLTLLTDISHIKHDGPAMMSILDTQIETCQHFFCSDGQTITQSNEVLPALSTRELEVLAFLAAGRSSKQIASELNIAIKTVDNHRQRMLQKTNSRSTGELVSFAIKAGYI